MAIFARLPIDLASNYGGYFGRTIGPRLRVSRRAMRRIACAFPDNSDAEDQRIVRGMWDNLGRALAEYPHLDRICSAGSPRVEIVNARIPS